MTSEWRDAMKRGAVDELEHLRAAGADIDARDEHGQTGIILAARDRRTDVVEWLVGRGANLDVTAKFGLTALMLAVVNGHVDVVRVRVRAGANLELRGTGAPRFAGKTALNLGDARGDREMVAILKDRHGGRSE